MKKLMCFVMMVFVVFGTMDMTDAKIRGGSSRSSSFSSKSSSRSSGFSSRSSSSTKSSSRSSTTGSRSSATKKTADQKAYESAKKSGKAFDSRSAAVADFKSKNASKYTSKYETKPATRPSHIPETTKVDGKTVNITYNQSAGGYGYTNALGTFIMYDMMSDTVMMNAMMSQQGYHIGGPPVVHSGSSLGWVVLIVVGVFVIIVCIVMVKDV